jgi:hypothetical protein
MTDVPDCTDCHNAPSETICDSCSRAICYACSYDDDGARICAFCHADRCEEYDSTDGGSFETDAIDPALAAALDDYVTRPPPECSRCMGTGLLARHPLAPVAPPTPADQCPECNPPSGSTVT